MEYFNLRCCMCPNISRPEIKVCPTSPATKCRFVKSYIDKRGWKYKVMSGIGEDSFKARYQKSEHTGQKGWKCLSTLEWRKTFDEAQIDLNLLAKTKKWDELL